MVADSKSVVLYVIDTLEVGGAEKSLLEIMTRMSKYRPVICFLYEGNSLEDRYRAAGIEVVSLGIRKKYGFLRAVWGLRAVIRAKAPVLMVTTLFRSDIVGRLAGLICGLKVVSSFVNDTYVAVRTSHMGRIRKLKHTLMWVLDFVTARVCVAFVANSNAIAESNARALRVSLGDVRVIYRGRPTDAFFPPARNLARSSGDDPLREPRIVCVARMEDRKGHLLLLEGFSLFRKEGGKGHLMLVGDGPFRPSVEQRCLALGLNESVRFLGTRGDVGELLRSADVFVSSSEYEGLPGAVVEAMLTGLPVVLSDMNVHREMVQHRVTGWLFERCPKALCSALHEVVSDRGRSTAISLRGLAWAREKFDIVQVVIAHEDFYSGIIGKRVSN